MKLDIETKSKNMTKQYFIDCDINEKECQKTLTITLIGNKKGDIKHIYDNFNNEIEKTHFRNFSSDVFCHWEKFTNWEVAMINAIERLNKNDNDDNDRAYDLSHDRC